VLETTLGLSHDMVNDCRVGAGPRHPECSCGLARLCSTEAPELVVSLRKERELADRLANTLKWLLKRMDLPGHNECDDKKHCPWSDSHEEVAIIQEVLALYKKDRSDGH